MSSALMLPTSDTLLSCPSTPKSLNTFVAPNWRRSVAANAWADAAFRRAYAHRLHTSSVYTPQPRSTYSILIVRSPRFTVRPCHYRDWSPGLAPHADLEAAYTAGRLTWDEFAAQYLARLQAFPWLLAEARARVATILDRSSSLTLLGLASACDETTVRCHRRLLRSWLLGESCDR